MSSRNFCPPHRIQNVALLGDPQKLVGDRYRVDVRVLPVVEVRVRTPDPLQHFDGEGKRLDGTQEGQTLVPPVLAEVAVHRVLLKFLYVT